MLARLVQFALAQRLFVLLAGLLLMGVGWLSFKNLPIEVEMLGIPKQRILRSVTKYGLVDVTVDFQDGTDLYWARQQVAERLNNIVGDLPSGITGGIAPITTPLGEMFMFTIEAPQMTLEERRSLLDWVIRPALRARVTRGADRLRPGEVVQARVPFAANAAGWALPLQAVARQDDQAYVFVRSDKGFIARPVSVVSSAGASVQVTGELKPVQEVATASVIALKAAWQGKSGGDK